MPREATQDTQDKVESSDKTWSTGEGNGKLLEYLEVHGSYTLEAWLGEF